MTDNTYKGEILNFPQLLDKFKVEIPIIQRDYAQGREDKKEIRTNFLNALYESLSENKAIKLDFIYGSKNNGAFLPLDGQQRLTTLFLIHWFAANKDEKLNSETKKTLNKFSYETRITSRDFCSSLINNSIEIINSQNSLSSIIKDSNWFFLSWKKDPTIDAMLRTLDDINDIFYGIENLWEKLTSKDNLISFYFVELENIGLTDDLYIKMNARGKLLTPYESFKAGLEKKIEENNWDDNVVFIDKFASKIDTTWTDFFWNNYRKSNTIDDALMRFISTIIMIRQSVEKSSIKADDRAILIFKLQENPNSVRPDNFSKQSFDYLRKSFDIYSSIDYSQLDLKLNFPLWRHTPQSDIFKEIVFEDNTYSTLQVNSASYTQKVLFFAQTEYLMRVKDFNRIHFLDWMRVIRNIISRGDIDKDGNRPDIVRSPQSFDGIINLVNELAEGCENIYEYLSSGIILKSQYAREQIEEEKQKAKLITYDLDIKKVIFETEDNDLLRGKIDFIFYCINYDFNIVNFDKNKFIVISNVFNDYFKNEIEISNDLRRALLTIEVDGKYDFYDYWWSFWNVVSATKRRLIDRFRELEYYINSDYKLYFKKLIDLLVDKSLKEIVDTFIPPDKMPNWKKRLITESELLDFRSKSNYIAIPDDNSCCYLLKSKRPRDIDGCFKVE